MSARRRIVPVLRWVQRHRNWLTILLAFAVMAFAGVVIARVLAGVDLDEIGEALTAITPVQIGLSLALAALSYLVLTGYDVLALHAIGKPQRYWRAAMGSFTSYVLSHNVGFAPVVGAAARWRAYRGTNLDTGDIARIVVIAGVTFWLGIFVMLGIFLILFPGTLRVEDQILSHGVQAGIGAAIMAAILLYLIACARQARPIRICNWVLPVPTLKQALAQFALAATDISIASAALLVLLPPDAWHHYPDFLVAYVVAMVVALITQAPGGLGVFEAVILVTLPEVDKPALVSALILYRLIYYWLPLLLALALMGRNEWRIWRNTRPPPA